MDEKVIAWARAVKSRQRAGRRFPVLWLFTDAVRCPDPRPAARALPHHLCGVVLRHDHDPQRARLARDLARICRARGNLLVISSDPGLAFTHRAGVHLRNGRGKRPIARFAHSACSLVTSSAHAPAHLTQARKAGAALAFLSPLFPTPSHPGTPALGPVMWSAWAMRAPLPCLALGGVKSRNLRRLPPRVRGIGAITALHAD